VHGHPALHGFRTRELQVGDDLVVNTSQALGFDHPFERGGCERDDQAQDRNDDHQFDQGQTSILDP
jgi:hypothetical protein